MSIEKGNDPKERIKLAEPKLQLKQPRSPGSGLKIVGALATVIALLLFIFGSGNDSKTIQVSPEEGAAAADQLEKMTKEFSNQSQNTNKTEDNEAEGDQNIELSGVQFTMHVPSGWRVSDAGEQKFVKKKGDSRKCQLTVDNAFDTAGIVLEAKGKEIEYESHYMKEALGMGIPKEAKSDVQIEVNGSLLSSNYDSTSLNYAVRVYVKMALGDRIFKQIGFNTTAASGKKMVRLQCVNMGGADDAGNSMEIMAKSLKLLQ